VTTDHVRANYTIEVGRYYHTQTYEVRQLLVPDQHGRFPGDRLCAEPYASQPLLYGYIHADTVPLYAGRKYHARARYMRVHGTAQCRLVLPITSQFSRAVILTKSRGGPLPACKHVSLRRRGLKGIEPPRWWAEEAGPSGQPNRRSDGRDQNSFNAIAWAEATPRTMLVEGQQLPRVGCPIGGALSR
jgi:hypothetical protein